MAGAQRNNPLAAFLTGKEQADTGGLPAVDRILDAVRRHLGMNIAFASRYVDGQRQFTHIQADIPVPARPGDVEPQEDTACYRILQGKLPELMHDASEFPLAAELPIVPALPVGSHLNVPLRLSDGSVYGSFCCISQKPDRSLTERDLETMRAFAALAAGQIERELQDDGARRERLERINALLDRDAIAIVYQPIHRLDTGAPVGVESLARFSDHDLRSPDQWFTEAADAGLGVELEMLAVRQAIRGLPYIPGDLYVAVNVSPETAMATALADIVAEAPAGRLVIEVTEHATVTDQARLTEALDRLRKHAKIAIDDVGVGYSGLRRILDLKPDILKLDMSLTRDIDSDPARAALAQAMVAFANGIGSRIVAEGIETDAEWRTLAGLGVGYGQGWHFSRPMPAVAAQHYLLGANAAAEERRVPALVRKKAAQR
jgi:EAL domain-containing protein (putative c-di-GMP-specific phosphodiesterase class I)